MRHHSGRVEVICGSMFSGKTEELIRRVRRAEYARQKVQIFKHAFDNRYAADSVFSHGGMSATAQPIHKASDILEQLKPDTTVVAIDEVQFLDDAVIAVCETLANQGIRVICAGLDLDFRAEPFGPIPALLSIAEEVTKLHAICLVCGEVASRSQRLVNGKPARYDDPIIMIGAQEAYEARCREHYEIPGRDLSV